MQVLLSNSFSLFSPWVLRKKNLVHVNVQNKFFRFAQRMMTSFRFKIESTVGNVS